MRRDAGGTEVKNVVERGAVGGVGAGGPPAVSSASAVKQMSRIELNPNSSSSDSSSSSAPSSASSSASFTATEPETIVKTLHERVLVEMRDQFQSQRQPHEGEGPPGERNFKGAAQHAAYEQPTAVPSTSSGSTSSSYKRYKFGLTNHFLTMPEPDKQPKSVQVYQEEVLRTRRRQDARKHASGHHRKSPHNPTGGRSDLGPRQVDASEHTKPSELIDSDDNCDLSVLPPSSADANSLLSHEAADEQAGWPAHQRLATSEYSAETSSSNLNLTHSSGGPLGGGEGVSKGADDLLAPSVLHDSSRGQARVSPAGDAGLDASRCNSKASSADDEFPYLSASKFDGLESNSSKLHHFEHHDHQNHHLAKKKRKLNGEPDDCASSGLLIRFSSIMYATFLVILGCILHVSELKQKSRNSSDHIYTTVVASVGILWLAFLQCDLQRYKKYASKFILLESIFNDHHQQRRLRPAGPLLEPASRSTTSSSASLVNDRMSMNTEVIFKKTAYKMHEQQARQHRQQLKQPYRAPASNLSSQHPYNSTPFEASGGRAAGARLAPSYAHPPAEHPAPQLVPAYKFLHGKMGANFYLKCGMAAFCFGHVIHEGLRFGQQVYFFAASNSHCRDSAALVAHLVTPLYSFYQLFMMFKYSNLVINRHKILARFGLMHIIGTCVTFWFRTILEEAFEDFVHKMDYFKAQNKPINHYLDPTTSSSAIVVSDGERAPAGQLASWLQVLSAAGSSSDLLAGGRNLTSKAASLAQQAQAPPNNLTLAQSALLALMSSPISATITPQLVRHLPDSYHCAQNTLLTTKSMNALPYLYPFTIEYNLLIAATFLSLYFNIGKIGAAKGSPPAGAAARCYLACCRVPPPAVLLSATDSASSASSRLYHPNSSPSAGHINKQPVSSSSSSSYLGSHLELATSHADISRSQSPMNRFNQQKQHALGEYKSNFVVNADCHAANKGLFLGFFVLLVTLVTIVIFFVTINKPSHLQLGIKINLIQEATLTSLILIVTLAGYRQIMRLNRNPTIRDKVTTDDVLMLIPLPFFFIHSLLSFRAETATLYSTPSYPTKAVLHQEKAAATTAPSLHAAEAAARFLKLTSSEHGAREAAAGFLLDLPSGLSAGAPVAPANLTGAGVTASRLKVNASSQQSVDPYKLLTIALNLAVMLEVLVQTNFIIDGLRRCSESRYLRFKKPGRELITFAILLNITYWIVATFETKSVEQYKTEIDYYGPLPYMFISHTTLPVMLFYRYHSSVCLAEIWNRAYKPPKRR